MRLLLLIVLILLVLGALPTWPYSAGWGYYPSGGLGLVLVIILILVLLGFFLALFLLFFLRLPPSNFRFFRAIAIHNHTQNFSWQA